MIDIDKLSEAELIDLNHRVVERLRFLQHMRAHARMLEFSIGDRVTFSSDRAEPIVGILTRYNRKTVTVITDDGRPLDSFSGIAHQSTCCRGANAASPQNYLFEIALMYRAPFRSQRLCLRRRRLSHRLWSDR